MGLLIPVLTQLLRKATFVLDYIRERLAARGRFLCRSSSNTTRFSPPASLAPMACGSGFARILVRAGWSGAYSRSTQESRGCHDSFACLAGRARRMRWFSRGQFRCAGCCIDDAADTATLDGAIETPIDAALDAAPDAPPPPLGAGWTPLSGVNPSPPGYRYAHAMVYDSMREQLVMFGGDSAPPYLSDTWVFDGFTWVRKTPAVSPQARGRHAMAFDSGRGRLVLFSGRNFFFDTFPETWEWDGATWIRLTPAVSPPTLFGAVMAYHAANARTILFGGSGPLGLLNDTWAWDGTTWTKLAPAMSPVARTEAAAVYDTARQRIVLFGGASQIDGNGDGIGDVLGDTWEWTGTTWLPRAPTDAPSPRFAHAMAYDVGRGRTVLFGGSVSNGGVVSQVNETWEWDGTSWARQITSTQPGKRGNHAMAYLLGRAAVFVYAGLDRQGISGDLWAFTGL